MQDRLDRIIRAYERLVVLVAGIGAAIIVVQMLWISYGVFVRYTLNRPDRMVTEATALLLFPVALLGLAYAMREDAYPRVTMLTDRLSPALTKLFGIVNHTIMLFVGAFFSITTINATLSSFRSGASSEILQWPRYIFWSMGALSLTLFTFYATLRLLQLILRPVPKRG
jgi:TRAP-type C4-dicarboxylate transport system permease small subunit